MMRSLYDESLLALNCTMSYDEAATIDNVTATYVTNYIMAVVGIISALSVWFMSPGGRGDIWMALFFAFFGIGNMIVSASSHILSHLNEVNSNIMLMLVVAHHFIVVSYSALLYTGIKSFSLNSIYLLIMKVVWLLGSVAILIVIGFQLFNAIMIWGLIVGVSMTFIYINQGIRVNSLSFMKALGIIMYISAYLVRSVLEEKCGTE